MGVTTGFGNLSVTTGLWVLADDGKGVGGITVIVKKNDFLIKILENT
jgi:hypothetical protein